MCIYMFSTTISRPCCLRSILCTYSHFQVCKMALQFYSASALSSLAQNPVSHKIISGQSVVCVAGDNRRTVRRLRVGSRVKSSLDASAAVAEVGRVTEVGLHTFWPTVEAAGTKVVVVDMYTQWCGPCKVMAPKFQQLSEKYDDVIFLKLDCNQDNKPLSKELGIKVVPTFKILKDSKIVKEVTGAKYDDLVLAIENARSS